MLENLQDLNALKEYEVLVKTHQALVISICWHYVKSEEKAEELAQEAFILAFHKLSSLNDKSKFKSWITKIATNVSLNYLRQNRLTFLSYDDSESEEALCAFNESEFCNENEAPAGISENELYQALYSLDFEKRNFLMLYYLQGFSIEKIANLLSLSKDATKKRLERARKNLEKEVTNMKNENRNNINQKDLSPKILELLQKPGLINESQNPVNDIWLEILKYLQDYKIIYGDEIISKDNHMLALPDERGEHAIKIDEKRVLRSQTTNATLDYIRDNPNEECKIVSAGRVWRNAKEDETHLEMFHQCDVLIMNETANEGDLLVLVANMLQTILPNCNIKMRTLNYPYGKRGWAITAEIQEQALEVVGATEIKTEVLQNLKINTNKMKAISLGIGLERLAMLKYNLKNIKEATVSK